MKWSDFSNSPYLAATDFEGDEEKTVIIKDIRSELIGRARENKPVAYFREPVKPLVLNVTNRKKIMGACGGGDDPARSIGAQVVLYVVETEFSGEPMLGIRVRSVVAPGQKDEPPAPKSPPAEFVPNARQRAKQKKSLAQEMDDEVPF
jgi:hypothetical protein